MGRTNKNRRLTTAIVKTILMLSVMLRLNIIFSASADWGMIPVTPGVSVYEPGQKAIIAWNGQEQILILTADVTSTVNTTVLQILPLPSNPTKIAEASLESFYFVEQLIWYYAPPPPPWGYLGNETDQVKVVFHEKIGMHDIIVVEAYNVSEFHEWMSEFLLKNEISQVSLEDFDAVIEDYMSRDFHFYVLDLLDLSSEPRSVEPILYKFDTNFLYYPLLITSPIGGDGEIILFLFTEEIIRSGYHPFVKAQYYGPDVLGPIQFEVSPEELSLIDPSIGELFEDKAWMTALKYEGPLGELTEDVMITLLTGDLNADGRVDILDVAAAAQAFGAYPGHPRWNPIADLNDDNIVNILDLTFIAKDFGKTWGYSRSVSGINDGLELKMTIESVLVSIGDRVNVTLILENRGTETLRIWFGSSQRFDLRLYYSGVPVAKWSDGMAFLMLVSELHLEPGETYTKTLNWNFYLYNPSTGDRYPPQPGKYEVVGICVGHLFETAPAVVTSKLQIELSSRAL